ncbi:MAG TPA: MBL fold metallo-hydrolase [Streptosporangiaceae bacterium]|nr:MBL fold metallo-hydrolase [Streptosporangiaceae bacterium]
MPMLTEIAAGVLVATNDWAMTTTTVVARPDGGCLLIDPAVTPADLSALAGELDRRGLRPRAGWATHPHWDHVLWSRELGDVPRFAAPAAAARVTAERDRMFTQTAHDAPGHDPGLFGRLTALEPGAGVIPWDGPAAQVIIHDAHAPGHGAVFLPGTGTLIAGDMCSDVEMPLLDLDGNDPIGDYRAGLARLAALTGVRQVVPGHGQVGDAAEFRRRIAADQTYLDALERGQPFGDSRLTQDWLRAEHDTQLRFASR